MTHGRVQEAEEIVTGIEARVLREEQLETLPHAIGSIAVHSRPPATLVTVARELFRSYPQRTLLGIVLMVTQSFMYNAISFTYPFVLTKFYGVPSQDVGLFIVPFALGNFLGPLLLGRWFDTIGRKPMIASTYAIAGTLLAITGYVFSQQGFTAITQTVAWSAIFFFASAGASAAYLTVSEIFPMEIRAMAIAFFFVIAQGAGILAPWLYGKLIETSVESVFYGYLLGGGLMLVGAFVELMWGVKAERQSLEHIAPPLSAAPARVSAQD
jgi:MFS family permease